MGFTKLVKLVKATMYSRAIVIPKTYDMYNMPVVLFLINKKVKSSPRQKILIMLLLLAHDKSRSCKLIYSMTIFKALLILITYFLLSPSSTISFNLLSLTSSVCSLNKLSTRAHSYLASMIVMNSESGSGFLISLSLLIGLTSFSSLMRFNCSSRVLK